jgi:hypothetical protein
MTGREKLLFGTMMAAQLADYETTRHCISAGGRELNPLLGDRPDDEAIALFKIASVGVIYSLGEILPEHREWIYGLGAILGGGAAGYNYLEMR